MEVDDALVDAHLKLVPCVGTVTARRLTGGDPEDLGGEPDGALDLQLLGLGVTQKLCRNYVLLLCQLERQEECGNRTREDVRMECVWEDVV